jgi:hypothetical protein
MLVGVGHIGNFLVAVVLAIVWPFREGAEALMAWWRFRNP